MESDDDDTIEFEIEVVTSSSSISLASNSIPDLNLDQSSACDKNKALDEESKDNVEVEVSDKMCQQDHKGEKENEINEVSTNEIDFINQVDCEPALETKKLEPDNESPMAETLVEVPEPEHVQVKADQNTASDSTEANDIESTEESSSQRPMISNCNDDTIEFAPEAATDTGQTSCCDNVKSPPNDNEESLQSNSIEPDQHIPIDEEMSEIKPAEIIKDQIEEESRIESVESDLNTDPMNNDLSQLPELNLQKVDGPEECLKEQASEIENLLDKVLNVEEHSTPDKPEPNVHFAEQQETLEESVEAPNPSAVDPVIIRDHVQGLETLDKLQQDELVARRLSIQTGELEKTEFKEEHSTQLEISPTNEIIIEPQLEENEYEVELQSDQKPIDKNVEVIITSEEDFKIEPGKTTPLIDDDLEREFDEEPEFEQRQVKLKLDQNLRDEYELGEELGRGRFGTVVRCVERSTCRKLAAKFVTTRRKEDREDVQREIAIMCKLQHKRLLQLYDAFDNGTNEMCIITELVEGGELFERIIDDDFELTEKKAAIFMRQICEGVQYMHSQQIVHLDMKPENILCLSKTGNRIKLIDFGLARQLIGGEPLRVMFGTPDFAAPEVLAYDLVNLATDMWSVGVICYVLLSGLSPFMGDNDIETMANVTRATYDFDDSAFDPISDLAKDFIAKLLVKDSSKRLKPEECLRHPWLQRGGVELEASVRERRESTMSGLSGSDLARLTLASAGAFTPNDEEFEGPIVVSLDKRNLKKYVVRRKWHKTVHAIMALGRMGANLKLR